MAFQDSVDAVDVACVAELYKSAIWSDQHFFFGLIFPQNLNHALLRTYTPRYMRTKKRMPTIGIEPMIFS